MPAATSREELLAVTHEEYDKLRRLVATVDEDAALRPDPDDTSIKDVVAHTQRCRSYRPRGQWPRTAIAVTGDQ